MLRELIKEGRFAIYDEPMGWEDAIRASVQPLVDHGDVTGEYADVIIEKVKQFGPYIVVAPDIALPHAQDSNHVLRSAACFVKFNHPVSFSEGTCEKADPEKTARLFFALSSEDEMKHLRNLRALTEECLKNRELIEKLGQASTKNEILEILVE